MKAYITRYTFCLAITLLSSTANAQTNNYWTENYGEYSILLNGAVIGSVEDLGAVYYNPARLRKDVESAFTLNTKAYQFSNTKIQDGAGEGIDLNQSDFNAIPSLAAGQFRFKKIPLHTIAYSFLTRNNVDNDFFIRQSDIVGDIISEVPGDELFAGQITLSQEVKEEWLGITWSFIPHEKLSIGVSNYFTMYKQKSLLDLSMQALLEDGHVALLGNSRIFDYKAYGLVWKVGFTANFDHVSLGMTLTTPKINVGGNGSFEYEDFLSGLQGVNENSDDQFEASYQDGLNARSKAPFSIGIGLGGKIKKNTLHIAAEWFNQVGLYSVIDTEPFTGQSTGDEIVYDFNDQRDHVVNAGIGADIFIADKVNLLLSFATDFSSRSSILDIVDGVTDEEGARFGADFFHYGFGLSFNARWADVSIGTVYSHTKWEARRPVNFPDENGQPVFDNETVVDVNQNRFRIILGITLPFMKEVMGDEEE